MLSSWGLMLWGTNTIVSRIPTWQRRTPSLRLNGLTKVVQLTTDYAGLGPGLSELESDSKAHNHHQLAPSSKCLPWVFWDGPLILRIWGLLLPDAQWWPQIGHILCEHLHLEIHNVGVGDVALIKIDPQSVTCFLQGDPPNYKGMTWWRTYLDGKEVPRWWRPAKVVVDCRVMEESSRWGEVPPNGEGLPLEVEDCLWWWSAPSSQGLTISWGVPYMVK